eukprot:6988916-Alexandrium_andersonii.AAC.1
MGRRSPALGVPSHREQEQLQHPGKGLESTSARSPTLRPMLHVLSVRPAPPARLPAKDAT